MFESLVYTVFVIGTIFIVWFAVDLMHDFKTSIRLPLDGEDRMKAFIRRSVVHDD